MDRRESLKSLLVGTVAGGLVLKGCTPVGEQEAEVLTPKGKGYGRTDEEKKRDEKLHSESVFKEAELETLAILCDIILPASADFGSATDAGVPQFIEFMAKDLPSHQLPLRGGLMWLDNRSNAKFGLTFRSGSPEQQLELIDEIAFPQEAAPEVAHGVSFFSLMRNLTLTGYYTTEMGIKDLGYVGNTPTVWDGVPDEVLEEHGLSYDPEWIKRYVNQDQRMDVASWDENGDLIT